MKSVYPLTFLLGLLISCNLDSSKQKGRIITGIYVMQAESEFGKSMDTLLITPYDEAAGIFQITSKTGYHRIRNGQLLPKEYKQEKTIVVWNKEHTQLEDIMKGDTYLFPSSGKELLIGNIRYEKIQ